MEKDTKRNYQDVKLEHLALTYLGKRYKIIASLNMSIK